MKMLYMEAPVLLITFNRPDTTKKVLDVLRKAKPQKLYVYNDGPRPNNLNDLNARHEINNILKTIDWACKLETNFPEHNQGCGRGVSGAISWAFNNEDRLIILEDDCVPVLSFFNYCNYCLEKYKDDEIVMQIAGNNYTENHNFTGKDYFFSKFGHISGWATWKRAWAHFDFNMTDWPSFRNGIKKSTIFDKRIIKYLTNAFNDYYSDHKKPWAIRWMYAKFKNNGLSIVPKVNLVKHIGVNGTNSDFLFTRVTDKYSIKNEPSSIICNDLYDKYHFDHHINPRELLSSKIIRKIKNMV